MRRRAALLLALTACGAADEPPPSPAETTPVGRHQLALTVEETVSAGCSTSQVEALSLQIIAQGNCITPGAYVEVPQAPGVSFGAAVLPYLEEPAQQALLAALGSGSGMSMQVNSMLRTVAQQYMLYRWYQLGSCGIGLAATPGKSNHESGLAIDIQQYAQWRPLLEAQGFAWLGSGDPVHFDYVGPGAIDYRGTDVQAFQQLHNLNNPADPIDEDGVYGPATEARLKEAPAEGFAVGPSCGGSGGAGAGGGRGRRTDDLLVRVDFEDAEDEFPDGASAGVADLIEGQSYRASIELTNTDADASGALALEVELPTPYLVASGYQLEVADDASASYQPSSPLDAPSSFGDQLAFELPSLEPGARLRLTIDVDAERYSIVDEAPIGLVFGVGGSERTLDADVYSQRQWQWNTARAEGWGALGGASLGVSGGELTLAGDSAAMAVTSPALAIDAASVTVIELSARRSAAQGEARLLFVTEDDATWDQAKSFALTLPADGSATASRIAPQQHEAWRGTIVGLRFLPYAGASDESGLGAAIDKLVLRGANNDAAPLGDPVDGDCSCRAAGKPTPFPSPWWALSAAALAATIRRRRHTGRHR
jgi:MYXO-CTERM domain-containing protein